MNLKLFKIKIDVLVLVLSTILGSCSVENNEPDFTPGDKPIIDNPDDSEEDTIKHNKLLGALFSFQAELRRGNVYKGDNRPSTYYNVPLFEAYPEGTEYGWWDNLVEEITYSGLDYVAACCRGQQPSYPKNNVDHGDPTQLKNLVEAMERRGVADKFKIALFDDCPASWESARNLDIGRGYRRHSGYPNEVPPYPLKDIEIGTEEFQDSIYKYIWDYNLRLGFKNVPEKYLLKYNGRPVVFLWSCSFVGDAGSVKGKLVYILDKIRTDCIKEFGMDPLLVVHSAWCGRDPDLYSMPESLGGINNWFDMKKPYTVRTYKGLTVGVGVPGFSVNDLRGDHMFLDANHGKLLHETLSYCTKNNSDIILLEGFTDVLENAAYWRSTDKVYYDFPNQRLNIIRRYSNDPYPKIFKVEAESCDYYVDKTSGNIKNQYRKGDLDIDYCDDEFGGWCVIDTEAGESLEWVELPFSKGQSIIKLRYQSEQQAEISFDIDKEVGQSIKLPATNGEWKDMEIMNMTFDSDNWKRVVLNIISGNIKLNYFTITSISQSNN